MKRGHGAEYDQINFAGQSTLGGTLAILLINGFTPSAGQSFNMLNWGSLAGAFSSLLLPSLEGLAWNTSQLATGMLSVVPAGLPGDYNLDGAVDAADYVIWRNGLGTTCTQSDYDVWRAHFGTVSPGIGAGSGAALPSAESLSAAVPEPGTLALAALSFVCFVTRAPRPGNFDLAPRSYNW